MIRCRHEHSADGRRDPVRDGVESVPKSHDRQSSVGLKEVWHVRARPPVCRDFLAYAVVALGSVILLHHLDRYVNRILVDTDSRSRLFIGIGIGAGIVYGVSSAVYAPTSINWLGPFVEGATLLVGWPRGRLDDASVPHRLADPHFATRCCAKIQM